MVTHGIAFYFFCAHQCYNSRVMTILVITLWAGGESVWHRLPLENRLGRSAPKNLKRSCTWRRDVENSEESITKPSVSVRRSLRLPGREAKKLSLRRWRAPPDSEQLMADYKTAHEGARHFHQRRPSTSLTAIKQRSRSEGRTWGWRRYHSDHQRSSSRCAENALADFEGRKNRLIRWL